MNNHLLRKYICSFVVVVLLSHLFILTPSVKAEFSNGASLSSNNFKILDSQHGSFGGISSSSSGNFLLVGNIGDQAIGSSSITNFKLFSGFLYYPKVISPVLNPPTAGNAQVSLVWSAGTVFQGYTISGYDICTKTAVTSYVCQDVGVVTSYTKTGLTNGTLYTFEIQLKDAFGNVIGISNEKTATPVAPAATPTPSSGGGGGGGGGRLPPLVGGSGGVTVSGISYPKSVVYVYIDSNTPTAVNSTTTGQFSAEFSNISIGNHSLSLYSQDSNGRKSITVSYSFTITADNRTTLSNVLIPTTIELSSYQLTKGQILRIFGQAPAMADVSVHVFSTEIVNKISSDNNGSYELRFNTNALGDDIHTTKSRAILSDVTGPFSQVLQFIVGKGSLLKTADSNKDNRVNIVDFSILLYWWGTNSSQGLGIADVNNDTKINIIDFSIMLFQWTG